MRRGLHSVGWFGSLILPLEYLGSGSHGKYLEIPRMSHSSYQLFISKQLSVIYPLAERVNSTPELPRTRQVRIVVEISFVDFATRYMFDKHSLILIRFHSVHRYNELTNFDSWQMSIVVE